MKPRYLRPSRSIPEIYLYREPIDFRKQANGLAVLVEQELGSYCQIWCTASGRIPV
jgi:hypothetical protein